MDRYRSAFAHLVATERFPGGFRWRFRGEPGLELELKTLAELEHDCCRFFQFDISKVGSELHWETRAEQQAESVLEEFSRLPDTLHKEPRRGLDVAAVKRAVNAAGLAFTADKDDAD